MQAARAFDWKVATTAKPIKQNHPFQTQCRSGSGGNGKCGGKCKQ